MSTIREVSEVANESPPSSSKAIVSELLVEGRVVDLASECLVSGVMLGAVGHRSIVSTRVTISIPSSGSSMIGRC
jgi:hypothetical protein